MWSEIARAPKVGAKPTAALPSRRPTRVGAPSFLPGLGGLTFRPAKAVIPAEVCFQAVNPNPRPMRDQQAPPPQPGSVALGCRASTPTPAGGTDPDKLSERGVRATFVPLEPSWLFPSWLGVFGEDMDGEVGVVVVPTLSLFVTPTQDPQRRPREMPPSLVHASPS